jgi:hypothetical protein
MPTPASEYEVTIAATGSPYTVTLDASPLPGGSLSVTSLALGSPDATLTHTGGRLGVPQMNIAGGAFVLDGGTLAGATVSGSGGQFTPRTGTLDGITLRRDAVVPNNLPGFGTPTLVVQNGLTLDGGSLLLMWANQLNVGLGVRLSGTQSIAGTGAVVLSGRPFVRVDGALTLGPGVLVRGGGEINHFGHTILNEGTIRADNPAFPLILQISDSRNNRLTNTGILEAAPGGSLILRGPFDNSGGVIRAAGGQVFIGDSGEGTLTVRTAELGTLQASGGGVIALTSIDNTGATLTATPATGNLLLGGLTGGTLASTGGAEFYVERSNPQLSDFRLTGRLAIRTTDSFNGPTPHLRNVVLDGGTIAFYPLSSGEGPNAWLETFGVQTIGGTGELVFEGASDKGAIRPRDGTLTFAPGITIRTGSGGGYIGDGVGYTVNQGTIRSATAGRTIGLVRLRNEGTIDVTSSASLSATDLANRGTVTASGASLTLGGAAWSNDGGTIRVTDGSTVVLESAPASVGTFSVDRSTLALTGPLRTSHVRAIDRSDVALALRVGGVLDNRGDTLTFAAGDAFRFEGGRLIGGDVTGPIEARVVSRSGIGPVSADLEAVTFSAPLRIDNDGLARVHQSLGLNGVRLTLDGRSFLEFPVSGTVSGTGEIVFDGAAEGGTVFTQGGARLTVGAGITIRTGSGDGTINSLGGPLTNNGTISAQSAGKTLAIQGSAVNSAAAVLEAKNGGTLNVQAVSNAGRMSVTGADSTLSLTGAWSSSGTIQVNDGALRLGGTFRTADLAGLSRTGINSSVTLTGALTNTGQTLNLDAFGPLRLAAGSRLTGGRASGSPGRGLEAEDATGRSTLDGVRVDAQLSIRNSATVAVAAPVAVSGPISITDGGKLDVGTSAVLFDYTGPTPRTRIRALLTSGYTTGPWRGPGIQSTTGNGGAFAVGYAESSDVLGPAGGRFAGYDADGSAILVRLTRYGDANVDGVVNGTDFARLAGNFGRSGLEWPGGDFNYDGLVNGADFALLASNFGRSAPALPTAPGAFSLPSDADWLALEAFGTSIGVPVPEPTVGVTLLAGLGLLLRRRRR